MYDLPIHLMQDCLQLIVTLWIVIECLKQQIEIHSSLHLSTYKEFKERLQIQMKCTNKVHKMRHADWLVNFAQYYVHICHHQKLYSQFIIFYREHPNILS